MDVNWSETFGLKFSFVFYIPIVTFPLKYWVTVIQKKKILRKEDSYKRLYSLHPWKYSLKLWIR